ncbi:hypothetical protein BC936DRAFT_136890 [Jimgerdemannia flammicorona]|uniref:Uncharacterized protein n=1 Tax=Jimgerdemannia flammicorona TaxID=994334 RepID=A0A433CYL9_9FUNG|nr:hypothetical protein BC936DRAFT_136890 [Jimgerdemannia flammicorona]
MDNLEQADYSNFTRTELQRLCKEYSLKASGKASVHGNFLSTLDSFQPSRFPVNAELIERLEEHLSSTPDISMPKQNELDEDQGPSPAPEQISTLPNAASRCVSSSSTRVSLQAMQVDVLARAPEVVEKNDVEMEEAGADADNEDKKNKVPEPVPLALGTPTLDPFVIVDTVEAVVRDYEEESVTPTRRLSCNKHNKTTSFADLASQSDSGMDSDDATAVVIANMQRMVTELEKLPTPERKKITENVFPTPKDTQRIVPMAMTPPTITAKFDKKHTRDFKKMDSITTHYSAGRPQTGLKRKNDQHQGGDATPDSPCKKRRFEDGSTATPGRSVPAKLKFLSSVWYVRGCRHQYPRRSLSSPSIVGDCQAFRVCISGILELPFVSRSTIIVRSHIIFLFENMISVFASVQKVFFSPFMNVHPPHANGTRLLHRSESREQHLQKDHDECVEDYPHCQNRDADGSDRVHHYVNREAGAGEPEKAAWSFTLDNAPLTAQKPVPSKSLAVPKASATTTVAPKVVNSKFCRSKSTVHRTAVVGKTEEPNLARSKSAVLPKRPVVAPVEPSRTKSSVTKKPAPVSLKGKVHIKADNPVKVEAVIEIPAPAPSPKRTRSATLLQKSQENQADRETSVPTAAVVPAPKPTKTINTKQAPVAAAREKEKDNKVDTAAAGPKPVASKTLATKRAVDKLEKVKTKTVRGTETAAAAEGSGRDELNVSSQYL